MWLGSPCRQFIGCWGSRNLHPRISTRAKRPCSAGGAGTAANRSFGPRYPIDLTAAAQLDFPCPMLNLQRWMLEHLLAGLLLEHGLAENRAAEPCPCNQKKGPQALGMTRAAAAAAGTREQRCRGPQRCRNPREGQAGTSSTPFILVSRNPLGNAVLLCLCHTGTPERSLWTCWDPFSHQPQILGNQLSRGCSCGSHPASWAWDLLPSWDQGTAGTLGTQDSLSQAPSGSCCGFVRLPGHRGVLFPLLPTLQSWFNQLIVFISCLSLSPFLRGQ